MNVLISLTALGIIAMFSTIFKWRIILLPLTLIGLGVSLVLAFSLWDTNAEFFNSIRMDNFAIAFTAVCIGGAIFSLLFYHEFFHLNDAHFAEVFAILLFSLVGVVVMVSFTNLLLLFLGVEILSLSLYIMAGLRKKDLLSNEAALKYFLMGAFSTGFLLFGIAMLYGATGSFFLTDIDHYLSDHENFAQPFIASGILLLMIGLMFKVSAAPFHFWTPDVYQGSPTLVTGYMATVGKVAAFAAFLRLFQFGFAPAQETYQLIIAAVAVVTMFTGNILALYQSSIKRMLAYSSISHAGYMLIALMTSNDITNSSVLYYSIAYTIASLPAFVIVLIVQQNRVNDFITSFHGLGKQNPAMAFVFAVSMISLSGIPPTAGFFAKFYIFSSAVKDGWLWIVLLAVVNSFISVYYYFRPVIASYMKTSDHPKIKIKAATQTLLILLTILTIACGLLPGILIGII
jgi:NADH-quinone oxidoreductase subunit N